MTENVWTEHVKSKSIVNVRKLDFVKNITKSVAITPRTPLKQFFEDSESVLSQSKQPKEVQSGSKESVSEQLDEDEL